MREEERASSLWWVVGVAPLIGCWIAMMGIGVMLMVQLGQAIVDGALGWWWGVAVAATYPVFSLLMTWSNDVERAALCRVHDGSPPFLLVTFGLWCALGPCVVMLPMLLVPQAQWPPLMERLLSLYGMSWGALVTVVMALGLGAWLYQVVQRSQRGR